MINKGIVLAGGFGTRLHPLTKVVSKQLLPVYDKPMVLYPIETLTKAGINDLLIITNPDDKILFERLLEDFNPDLNITFAIQNYPNGIAEALIIAKDWLDNEGCALILGDNIFLSESVDKSLKNALLKEKGATIFGFYVDDPSRYGVIDFEGDKVLSIEEKPERPKSNWAATGLYVYDSSVCKRALALKPSERGEIEITDLNISYLKDKNLNLALLDRDSYWLDAGTFDSLLEAGILVKKLKNI